MEHTLKIIYLLSKPYLVHLAVIVSGLFFTVSTDRYLQKKFSSTALKITDGTLESIKWLAVVLMTLDHVNKYIYHESITPMYYAGRLVMPLFAFVLAYNLARPGALEGGAFKRVITRLAAFGAIASIPYMLLGNHINGLTSGWWPMNILFMLLASTIVIKLISDGDFWSKALGLIVGIVAGCLVEFWWPAIIFCVASWYFCKKPGATSALIGVLALLALYVINKNLWALACIPFIAIAPYIELKAPRYRNFFYVYYPAHLMSIWLIIKFV